MLSVQPIFCSTLPPDLKTDWTRLWEVSALPSFQYEFVWMQAWTTLLRGPWNPLLLVARENGCIKGIMPLMYRDDRRKSILPYRRVCFLGSDATDFSTVLAAPEDMNAVVEATLAWLFSGTLRWELLILDDLPDDHPAILAVSRFLADHAHSNSIDCKKGRYFYIHVDRPWDQIWKETSNKYVRRNVNLAKNRLDSAGAWSISADPDWSIDKIIETAAPIHIARQAALGRPSRYADPAYREFLYPVIESNLRSGRFRSHWLQIEGKPIAFLFGFAQGRVYYAWNMAFYPEQGRFYPSRMLFAHVLKESSQNEIREFNMMRGEAEYKKKWTEQSRENIRFRVRRRAHIYGKLIHYLEHFR